MSEVVLTKENFEKEVIGYDGIILVDFWAPWCGPCRALGPVMSEIAEEAEKARAVGEGLSSGGELPSREKLPSGALKVGKVNVDEERDLAERFNVMSIPTVKVFNGGKEVGSFVGFMPKEDILDYVKKVVL